MESGTIKQYFTAAERCQHFLASLAPEGSPSRRYLSLLAQLRYQALGGRESRQSEASSTQNPGQGSGAMHTRSVDHAVTQLSTTSNFNDSGFYPATDMTQNAGHQIIYGGVNDQNGLIMPGFPQSDMDFDTLEFSWGYLDQLGMIDKKNCSHQQYADHLGLPEQMNVFNSNF